MILLAIDTAGGDCSAAVYDSETGVLLGAVTETIGTGHAEKLMAMIDGALEAAGLPLEAVERIAVTVGPGSFTGIRVGVSAARGLALALGIAAVGISTLQVLAATAPRDSAGRPVLAAMDAKRGEIYAQLFSADGKPLTDAEALTVEAVNQLLSETKAVVVGSAMALLADGDVVRQPDRFPIGVVARLGADAEPAGRPKPLYLRGPDAKVQTGFAIARM